MTYKTAKKELGIIIDTMERGYPESYPMHAMNTNLKRFAKAVQAYRDYAEARIKELESALRQSKYTANVFEESSIRDAKVKNEFADKVRAYQTVVKEMQYRINVLEELMQWKPIDSAPRDGRIILLMGNDPNEMVVISDWWHSYANGDGHWEYADAMDDFNPTHWMEMP